MLVFLGIILLVNLLGLLLMKIDKVKAQKHQWRISEKTLLGWALFYGSYGIGLGMLLFRHKTRHWQFKVWVPFCLLWQTGLLFYLLWR